MFCLPISRHSLLKKRIDHSGNLPLLSSLRLQAELTFVNKAKQFCLQFLSLPVVLFSFHFLLSLSLSFYTPFTFTFLLSLALVLCTVVSPTLLPLAFIHAYGSIYTIEPPGWADLSCPIPFYYLCWHSLSLCPQLL